MDKKARIGLFMVQPFPTVYALNPQEHSESKTAYVPSRMSHVIKSEVVKFLFFSRTIYWCSSCCLSSKDKTVFERVPVCQSESALILNYELETLSHYIYQLYRLC